MKLAVVGSRSYNDYETFTTVMHAVISEIDVKEFVSGGAKNGADRFIEKFSNSVGIPIKIFPAKWHEFGKGAGFIRNVEIWDYADSGIAFWDGSSKGTKHSFKLASDRNKWILVYRTDLDILE